MKIQIVEFKGIMPKLANDKLPNNMAQIASDLKTASGELVAIKASSADVALAGDSYKTFFEYLEGSNKYWVYYDDIAFWSRSHVAEDTFERMYVTVDGDYRCFANDIISGGGFDFTTDFYEPTAPVDMTAPTIDNATPGAVYRAYLYTWVSRYGEESGPSLITESTIYTAGEAMEINAIEAPTAVAGEDQFITPSGSGANLPKMRFYRTATDGTGSADFLLVCEAVWFDLTGNTTYAAGDHVLYDDGGGLDLYRCTIAGTGTWGSFTGTMIAGELVADADLGVALPTSTWSSIPAGMTNLRSHPNGFFVASKGRELWFSEPFDHHSWPEDYKITIDANIVGLGIFGSTIVVCTDANIFTFAGPHPTSLYKSRLSFQPCLSQRGVVETDDGVIFPAKAGFHKVSNNGVVNVTKDLFSPDDWDDFELTTIHGHWYNDAYYGFFSDEVEGNIRIDFLNQSITTGADYHQAGYVALQDGVFRTIFASDIDSSDLYISQWDNDPTRYRNFQYKSPRYILEKPANFKVCQLILDTDFYNEVLEIIGDDDTLSDLNTVEWATGLIDAPINGAAVNSQDVNGDGLYSLSSLGVQSYVDFNIYVDSVLKFTKQVSDSQMFKLPRGFKHKKWELEVIGMIPVKRITMATSTEEIV